MHGRPRPVKGLPLDPEKSRAAKQRVAQYSQLTSDVLRRRAARQYDGESLDLAAKLLEQNPEVYTLWNYRRKALNAVLQGKQGSDAAVQAAQAELQLTEVALRKNPKSYAAWHHRKWVIQKRLTDLQDELKLVSRLLDADDRNFHGWGYRQFIVQLAGLTADYEDKYTMQKVEANFSNYSAWHGRTAWLQKLHGTHTTTSLASLLAPRQEASSGCPHDPVLPAWALDEEFKLVHEAFFTDPADQSAWLYHRWLLAQAAKASGDPQDLQAVLQREASTCEDILQMEDNIATTAGAVDQRASKWPLLTLARLREAQASDLDNSNTLYNRLALLDPMRKGFYQDAANKQVLISTGGLS